MLYMISYYVGEIFMWSSTKMIETYHRARKFYFVLLCVESILVSFMKYVAPIFGLVYLH